MKRAGPLLTVVLTLLSACVANPPRPDTRGANMVGEPAVNDLSGDVEPTGWAGVGRSGPDGATLTTAPVVAERGIGGTGAPAATPPTRRTADRGIGGTGIVGVVTGFGSVFVNGMEIQYDESARIDVDGDAAAASALRAGQLVAIRADGPPTAPRASAISVQSAVIGRIEALELGSGTLTIAGQAVAVPVGTWGGNRFGLGDWVKVSGLRRADQTIVASRLDAAPAGVLLARGPVVREGDVTRVGKLVLSAPVAAGVRDGEFVVVSGNYATGRGRVSAVAPDTLFPDPAAFFGSSANRLIVQAFVGTDKDSFSVNGVKMPVKPAVASLARHDGIAVVSLERDPAGSYVAVGLRYSDYRGHTEPALRQQRRSGRGDSSEAPQQNGHTPAIVSQQAFGGDSGTAANGQVATPSTVSDPYPVIGSSNATPVISSAETPTPVVADPVATRLAPVPPAPTPPAPTPPAPTLPTQTLPTQTLPTQTPATPASTMPKPPTGVPMVEHVNAGAQSAGQGIGRDAGHATSAGMIWEKPTVKVARPGANRWGPTMVKGSSSGPTLNQLTTAVTSVSTTNTGTLGAATGLKTFKSGARALRKGTSTIGTSARGHSGAGGTGPSRH